jgi:5'-3' exonuclease
MKKLFLFDAMALIYRAHFAFAKTPRISSKGMNTSAVFGFANTIFTNKTIYFVVKIEIGFRKIFIIE